MSEDQNGIEGERKRHDLAEEKYQGASDKYQENGRKLLYQIAAKDRINEQAMQNFADTDHALKLCNKACNQELDLREPQFSDFFEPSTQQK